MTRLCSEAMGLLAALASLLSRFLSSPPTEGLSHSVFFTINMFLRRDSAKSALGPTLKS